MKIYTKIRDYHKSYQKSNYEKVTKIMLKEILYKNDINDKRGSLKKEENIRNTKYYSPLQF